MLLDLGAGQTIVGRTQADANIAQLKGLPAVGTHMRPNAEIITALQPDLVLQMAGRKEAMLYSENLRQLGVQVLTFDIANFYQLFSTMKTLGQIVGQEAEAEKIISQWQTRLSALNKGDSRRPTVYYEARGPQLLAAGSRHIVAAIIEEAGGENIIKDSKKLVRINEELLLLTQPEICILQNGPMNPDPIPLGKRPGLETLPCVQNGLEFVVDEKIFARPGSNSIAAAEEIARMVAKAKENK